MIQAQLLIWNWITYWFAISGNHLSQQEEAARAAASKHIYLSAASQGRNVYSDRDRAAAAALHQRSLAPPPAAHTAVSAAAAAAVYSRPGSIISGFQRYTNLPSAVTTANSIMLASSISSSPRTNGTGPTQSGSRYYRDWKKQNKSYYFLLFLSFITFI